MNAEGHLGGHAIATFGLPNSVLAEATSLFPKLGFRPDFVDGFFDQFADFAHGPRIKTLFGVPRQHLSVCGACFGLTLGSVTHMHMSGDESEIGKLVERARRAKGMTQTALASAVGTKQQTIEKIEQGKIKHSSFLPAIAQELSIAVERVVRNAKPPSAVEQIPGAQLFGERDLKVYAAVQGGPGAMILSNEPVDYVLRPEPLARVKDGYGVIVIGESMAPAIEPGDIVCVNKHLPPRAGDDCVFQFEDEEGTWHASVKRLRRATETTWQVTEWNSEGGGARDFSLKRAEWRTCHVIVAIYKRR